MRSRAQRRSPEPETRLRDATGGVLQTDRRAVFRLRNDQATTSAAAYLTALAAGRPCFVSGPFVRCTLFMRRAPALAGDLALLFGRHRRKPSTFLLLCGHGEEPPLGKMNSQVR